MTADDGIFEAEIKLTAELLEKLGVFSDVNQAAGSGFAKDTKTRIDEYGKYFKQLFKVIHERFKE